jgi:hypothetical protein
MRSGVLMDNCSPHIAVGVIAVLTSVRVRVITFASHTTYIFQTLDVVLFGAMKKHATGLETLDEGLSAAAFLLKVYHDFKQTMIEVNIWGPLLLLGSAMILPRIHTGYSSMRKTSDKARASWSHGKATRHWRVCRSANERQSLDGLTNQNKSI